MKVCVAPPCKDRDQLGVMVESKENMDWVLEEGTYHTPTLNSLSFADIRTIVVSTVRTFIQKKTKTSPCEKHPAMRVSDIMRLALGARLPLSLCSQMEQKCNSFLLCIWKSEILGVEGEAAISSISGSLGMAGEPLSRRCAPGPISLYQEGWNHCWNPEKSQSGAWHKFSSLIFKAE